MTAAATSRNARDAHDAAQTKALSRRRKFCKRAQAMIRLMYHGPGNLGYSATGRAGGQPLVRSAANFGVGVPSGRLSGRFSVPFARLASRAVVGISGAIVHN